MNVKWHLSMSRLFLKVYLPMPDVVCGIFNAVAVWLICIIGTLCSLVLFHSHIKVGRLAILISFIFIVLIFIYKSCIWKVMLIFPAIFHRFIYEEVLIVKELDSFIAKLLVAFNFSFIGNQRIVAKYQSFV